LLPPPPEKKLIIPPPKKTVAKLRHVNLFWGEQCITNVSRVTNISKTFTHYGGENELA